MPTKNGSCVQNFTRSPTHTRAANDDIGSALTCCGLCTQHLESKSRQSHTGYPNPNHPRRISWPIRCHTPLSSVTSAHRTPQKFSARKLCKQPRVWHRFLPTVLVRYAWMLLAQGKTPFGTAIDHLRTHAYNKPLKRKFPIFLLRLYTSCSLNS